MTILGFLSLNLRDAEARIRRLTAPDAPDPPELWGEMNASAPGRLVMWVHRSLLQAGPESRAWTAWLAATRTWEALDRLAQMRAIGAVALIAAVVHVALVSTTAPVGGWWLIVPGIVAAFGMAAFMLSWMGPQRPGGGR
jgi:hypothetical protein